MSLKNKNLRTEPKHIVFLTQLLLLFKFCHTCKADNPTVEASENGTEAIVKTYCNNPKCNKKDTWHSQPLMPGLRIPAGDFLLCLSIRLAGGSATKVFRAFSHMGLGCVSLNTFFKYQRVNTCVCLICLTFIHIMKALLQVNAVFTLNCYVTMICYEVISAYNCTQVFFLIFIYLSIHSIHGAGES